MNSKTFNWPFEVPWFPWTQSHCKIMSKGEKSKNHQDSGTNFRASPANNTSSWFKLNVESVATVNNTILCLAVELNELLRLKIPPRVPGNKFAWVNNTSFCARLQKLTVLLRLIIPALVPDNKIECARWVNNSSFCAGLKN